MPLIIIYDLRKNKAPDKFFPRKSRICQGLKIYFQMFMKKMEEFRVKGFASDWPFVSSFSSLSFVVYCSRFLVETAVEIYGRNKIQLLVPRIFFLP